MTHLGVYDQYGWYTTVEARESARLSLDASRLAWSAAGTAVGEQHR
jgi:hypothetical protein